MIGRFSAVINSATGVINLPWTLTSRMARSNSVFCADLAGLGRDPVAQFFQHFGDHHPDHDLVFDEEYGQGRRRGGSHQLHLPPTDHQYRQGGAARIYQSPPADYEQPPKMWGSTFDPSHRRSRASSPALFPFRARSLCEWGPIWPIIVQEDIADQHLKQKFLRKSERLQKGPLVKLRMSSAFHLSCKQVRFDDPNPTADLSLKALLLTERNMKSRTRSRPA